MPQDKNKIAPETPAELKEALASGKLDGRSRYVKTLKDTRTALASDPVGASRAVLETQVALNLAVQQSIMEHALRPGTPLVTPEGRLDPLLADDLVKLQASTRTALRELRQLAPKPDKGKKAETKPAPSVADLILDVSEEAANGD